MGVAQLKDRALAGGNVGLDEDAIVGLSRNKLQDLIDRVNRPTLSANYREYVDTREGHGPHKAINLTLFNPAQLTGRELLTNCLGAADAKILIDDIGPNLNLDQKLPASFTVALFLDSNNKARNSKHAPAGAKTTQEEDFKGAGLQSADKLESAIASAIVVRTAREGRLSPEERDVFTKLKSGFIRHGSSGTLYVDDEDGRLRAFNYHDDVFANFWAFGSLPAN